MTFSSIDPPPIPDLSINLRIFVGIEDPACKTTLVRLMEKGEETF